MLQMALILGMGMSTIYRIHLEPRSHLANHLLYLQGQLSRRNQNKQLNLLFWLKLFEQRKQKSKGFPGTRRREKNDIFESARSQREAWVEQLASIAGRVVNEGASEWQLDPEVQENLEALGYL